MNPCRECEGYIINGKNHGKACGQCDKRIKYVASLGKMTHSMPDALRNEKGAFMAPPLARKTCKDPDCDYGGTDQPVSKFPGKRGGGTKNTCRNCCVRNIRLAKEKRANERMEAVLK